MLEMDQTSLSSAVRSVKERERYDSGSVMRVMEGQMGTGKPCTGGTCIGSRESDGPSKNRGFQRMPWISDGSTAQRVTFKQRHRTQNKGFWDRCWKI